MTLYTNFGIFKYFIFICKKMIFSALIGEVDEEQDKIIDLSTIRAEPLQQIAH